MIFYGKGGDIATNRRDEQELSVLCLRVLQAALVYVNTLMVQDIRADDEWAAQLTDADRCGLTPLFWTHVVPYGEVKLDMTSRLTSSGHNRLSVKGLRHGPDRRHHARDIRSPAR